jgi:RP/EB family microtubule-associated protein
MGSAKMDALAKEVESLKLAVERTEQEREFYFEKLQDVEFLCQRPEFIGQHLTKVVEKVLYFTEGKPDVDAIIAECAAESTGSVVTPTEAGVPPVDTEAPGDAPSASQDVETPPAYEETAAVEEEPAAVTAEPPTADAEEDAVTEEVDGECGGADLDATVEAEERAGNQSDADGGDVTMDDVPPSPAAECGVPAGGSPGPAAARAPLSPVQNVVV